MLSIGSPSAAPSTPDAHTTAGADSAGAGRAPTDASVATNIMPIESRVLWDGLEHAQALFSGFSVSVFEHESQLQPWQQRQQRWQESRQEEQRQRQERQQQERQREYLPEVLELTQAFRGIAIRVAEQWPDLRPTNWEEATNCLTQNVAAIVQSPDASRLTEFEAYLNQKV